MKFRKLTASLLSVALSGTAAISAVLPAASMAVHAEETSSTDMSQYGTNLALNKTATASSIEASSVAASNAVDGDTTSHSSRWGSNVGNGPDWIYIDLAKPSTVKAVRVFWESYKATSYKIQYATENPGAEASWKDVKVFNARPTALTEVIPFDTPVNARYIRLYIGSHTSHDPQNTVDDWNTVSIFELEVYGEIDANYQDPNENVALNKTELPIRQKQQILLQQRHSTVIHQVPAGVLLRQTDRTGFMSIWAKKWTYRLSVFTGKHVKPITILFLLQLVNIQLKNLLVKMSGPSSMPTMAVQQS
ncbi:discoidin domain-containing protein [Allobaculum mucilyticum]|nr:discoidin domain-containing protein [Allobaculum mucilyticum]UNT95895.1 discoidin domain-containing protein [Allobaculum mucilyticum]